MRALTSLIPAVLTLATTVTPAAAQPLPPRFFVSVNGGYQPTATEFDDRFTFTLHQETGTTRARYRIDGSPVVDAGFGVALGRRFRVGIAVSRFSRDGVASVASSIPHPLYLGQNREVAGEAAGLNRTETGVHLHVQYPLPLGRNAELSFMAGLSTFTVRQAILLDVNYAEGYPYDTAAFAGVDSRPSHATRAGFNVGADLRYMFSRRVGLGALLRVARASVRLDTPDGRTIPVTAGGTQLGVGLRLAFGPARRRPAAPPGR